MIRDRLCEAPAIPETASPPARRARKVREPGPPKLRPMSSLERRYLDGAIE
jgi:hypothetical protein